MSTILCVAALGACGESDDPEPSIPEAAGNAIMDALDQVETRVAAGDCDGAEATAQNVRDAIGALPEDVPEDVQQTLIQASDNLVAQTRDPSECEEAEEPPPPVDTGATGAEGVEDG